MHCGDEVSNGLTVGGFWGVECDWMDDDDDLCEPKVCFEHTMSWRWKAVKLSVNVSGSLIEES